MYDYDEYEPTKEEIEKDEGFSATETRTEEQKLHIDFDVTTFSKGIVDNIKKELRNDLYNQVVAEIRKECLEDLHEIIKMQVGEIVRSIIVDFMENEKIVIGGSGWDEEPRQELTMMQYAKRCIRNIIRDETFEVFQKVEIKRNWNDEIRFETKSQKMSFEEYIRAHCGVDNEIKKYLDKQIALIRDEINKNVKATFDESTKTMLSEAVLKVLMANDTYKKIENNIACLASAN